MPPPSQLGMSSVAKDTCHFSNPLLLKHTRWPPLLPLPLLSHKYDTFELGNNFPLLQTQLLPPKSIACVAFSGLYAETTVCCHSKPDVPDLSHCALFKEELCCGKCATVYCGGHHGIGMALFFMSEPPAWRTVDSIMVTSPNLISYLLRLAVRGIIVSLASLFGSYTSYTFNGVYCYVGEKFQTKVKKKSYNIAN